ncbi:MAG: hypothetical protein PHU14_01085 [Methylovulum sp.]|nr:hypothetical protein [Methylovulum sp.]
MLQVIVRAIRERELLAFVYGSFTRVAEPYAVGESVTGNNVLWAFQLSAEHLAIHHGISHYPVLGSIGLGYE